MHKALSALLLPRARLSAAMTSLALNGLSLVMRDLSRWPKGRPIQLLAFSLLYWRNE
jgi:hypothetical protein